MTSTTIRLALAVFVVLSAALGMGCSGPQPTKAPSGVFHFSEVPHGVEGQALLLAIDNHLLPISRDLSLYYTTPQARPEPVLTPSRDDPSKPDYIATHFYGTVLFDQGK